MTSQYEISGKISVAQSKRFPSEVQSTRHRKNSLEQAAFSQKVKVLSYLPTSFLHLNADFFRLVFIHVFI